jgi:hypothetical protein
MVSAAAPALSRQAGQSPASAPVGSGVPHCGHLFPSGMGAFIFTVSMPTSEAKPEVCYQKSFAAKKRTRRRMRFLLRLMRLFAANF